MSLDWQNPNYFTNNLIYPNFDQPPFHFQDPNDIFLPLSNDYETELLSFDPLPPTLFDFDDPQFDLLPLQHLDFNHDLFTSNVIDNNNFLSYADYPPPVIVPAEEILSFDDDYSSQFIPFSKKQKLSTPLPCFDNEPFIPELYAASEFNVSYDYHYDNGNGYGYCGSANYDEEYGSNNDTKVKAVSTQSRAARERRRRITEKTRELGKLIPGGHKMNTAEMFQAAAKYVKFMQAQVGVLESIKALQENNDTKAKLNNLPILSSQLVQEKLYTKEKCLVPLDFLPMLELHCDSGEDPSTSQQIKDLLH